MVVDISVAENEPERSPAVRCVLPRACCTGCALCGRCRGNAGFHKRHEVRPCCPVTCAVRIAACVMCVFGRCCYQHRWYCQRCRVVYTYARRWRTHAARISHDNAMLPCGRRQAGARAGVPRILWSIVFIFGAGCMRLSYSMTILLPTLFVFSRPRSKGPYAHTHTHTHTHVLAGRVPAGTGPHYICRPIREMRGPW